MNKNIPVPKTLHAGELCKYLAKIIGGNGGGGETLGQGGGNSEKIDDVIKEFNRIIPIIANKIK